MGIVYSFLAVSFSLTVAQILKITENKSLRVLPVLVINYAVATLIGIPTSPAKSVFQSSYPPVLIIIAVIIGVLFIANLFVYSKSIDANGMGVSIASMRLSLAIPVGVSLFVYSEELSVIKISGVLLSFVALLLLVPRLSFKKVSTSTKASLLILIFFFTGISDSGLKIFEQEFGTSFPESLFLSIVFFSAFILGLFILIKNKELHFNTKELLLGTLLGLANHYSVYFVISALQELPGAQVFPIVNLAIVIGGALIGVLYWKDSHSKKQWIGLAIACISITLLV